MYWSPLGESVDAATLPGRSASGFSKTARSCPGHGEAGRDRNDLCAPPVFRRRFTDDLVECLAEGAHAREADVQADVGDAPIRAAQQVERPFDSPALQVAVRGLPERGAKR